MRSVLHRQLAMLRRCFDGFEELRRSDDVVQYVLMIQSDQQLLLLNCVELSGGCRVDIPI